MNDIRKTNTYALIIMYAIVIIFTILAVYPIFWVVMTSFKTTQEYMMSSKLALPQNVFFKNYPIAWRDANFSTLIMNSIFYTAVTTGSIIILSFMAGFAFAKLPSKATPVIHSSFIIGILITLQCIMVPLFILIRTVGLYNTRLGVLIPYIGIGLPLGVYLATEYIKGIPNEVIESARIDGAKYLGIFWKIILPMAAPVATTVAILQVTGTWNEFMLINILVSSDRLKTVPLGINMFSGALATDYGKQFSALVIGMMPMIFFYVVFRKQITKGVSAGAVKG